MFGRRHHSRSGAGHDLVSTVDPQGDRRCPGLVQRDGVHLLVRCARSFPRTDDGARSGAGSDLRDVAGGHRGAQRMMATSESQAAAEAETAPGVDKHHASRCRT